MLGGQSCAGNTASFLIYLRCNGVSLAGVYNKQFIFRQVTWDIGSIETHQSSNEEQIQLLLCVCYLMGKQLLLCTCAGLETDLNTYPINEKISFTEAKKGTDKECFYIKTAHFQQCFICAANFI